MVDPSAVRGSTSYRRSSPKSMRLWGFLRNRSSPAIRSEEHTSELQSHSDLVCRLLLEKKKNEPAAGSGLKPVTSPTETRILGIRSAGYAGDRDGDGAVAASDAPTAVGSPVLDLRHVTQ